MAVDATERLPPGNGPMHWTPSLSENRRADDHEQLLVAGSVSTPLGQERSVPAGSGFSPALEAAEDALGPRVPAAIFIAATNALCCLHARLKRRRIGCRILTAIEVRHARCF